MSIRLRTALSVAVVAALVAVPSARAQDVVVPASVTPVPSSAPAFAPAGPTTDAAAVGVRQMASGEETAPQRRRGGSAPGVALMIVGGAAILVGLVIGSGAGAAIAVAGAVVGLYGLYQYLQ